MGLMARYSGDFMPLKYSCNTVRYSTPISSSLQRTIRPRDIGFVWKTSSLVLMAAHPWREMGEDDTPSRPPLRGHAGATCIGHAPRRPGRRYRRPACQPAGDWTQPVFWIPAE